LCVVISQGFAFVSQRLETWHMTVLKDYALGDPLGTGAFAVCYLGHRRHDPDSKVAVKSVLRGNANFDDESIKNEIAVMKVINHPHCVNLVEVLEDQEAVHIIQELAAGGELFDRIIEAGNLSEKDSVHLIHQVFDGLQYLHIRGIIRDLKPENLLMVGREPGTEAYMMLKIADFGLSAQRTEAMSEQEWTQMVQNFCGTTDYLAPEVFKIASTPKKGNLHYTAKVDVWAVGVIYYIMLCGSPPFWAEHDDNAFMIQSITSGSYQFHSPEWDGVSEDSKDLIRKCLAVDVSQRSTALDLMNHGIFANHRLPNIPLNNTQALAQYKARVAMKRTLRSVQAASRLNVISRGTSWANNQDPDPDDERHKEAVDLFLSIDAMGDGNGTLELFEIILYMQSYHQHLFLRRGPDDMDEIDQAKLKSFAELLRNSVDRNQDGFISKNEFVTGYCIWKMHISKATASSEKNILAARVYA